MGRSAFISGLKNVGFGETMPFECLLEHPPMVHWRNPQMRSCLPTADMDRRNACESYSPASMYSAFMNDGNMLQPYLVSNSDELGGEAPQPGSYWKTGVFTSETAQIINEDLRTVITEGTGTQAQSAGVTLAGKTGTAK